MRELRLGDSGVEVSALCPGAVSLGTKLDEKGSFAVRDTHFIATQAGFKTPSVGNSLSRKVTRREPEGSPRRMGIDTVDFCCAHKDHRPDPLEKARTLSASRDRAPCCRARSGKVRLSDDMMRRLDSAGDPVD